MPYSVSSWFIDQCAAVAPNIIRRLYIGNSDYSERVIKWPKINRKWNDIKSQTITIGLYNQDQAMNFIRDDKTKMRAAISAQIGFVVDPITQSTETIELFNGVTSKVQYAGSVVNLTATDKFKQLEERVIGSDAAPVTYTSSEYLPSDLAWYIVTSHGGMSAITNSSNPDIDWTSFQSWAAVFSRDNVRMQAEFNGTKVIEAIRKLSRETFSGVYIKQNKIAFARFGLANANVSSIGPDRIKNVDLFFDDELIVNRQHVSAAFSSSTDFWAIATQAANSASVNSFGLREETEKDENIWYANSASALNLAQRLISVRGLPYDQITVKMANLTALTQLIGETVYMEDAFHTISESYRLMEHSIDMDTSRLEMRLDRSQLLDFFQLDVSTLDGESILS